MHARVERLVRIVSGPRARRILDGIELDLPGPGVHH